MAFAAQAGVDEAQAQAMVAELRWLGIDLDANARVLQTDLAPGSRSVLTTSSPTA